MIKILKEMPLVNKIWISACCRRRSNHHTRRLTLRRRRTAYHHTRFSKGVNLCGCERGGGGFPARYARRSSLRIIHKYSDMHALITKFNIIQSIRVIKLFYYVKFYI
ncbi:hypothetical protein ALC53_01191 [Atta colombica]|uniref:Uncharacterized protein n=1 Tax=Atta colombica TaxID=520822 RepID=A0A195BVY0_9HYME|nr:hypothetical protein ALC53_01191 [Atta colombica]